MTELLKGKSAIITGSSRGIGRAIALAFAEHGSDVVVHGTNKTALSELKKELQTMGARCECVTGDIGELNTARILTEACLDAFGKVDVLVNNAGINNRKTFDQTSPDEWNRILRVNLTGAFYMCKCVVPHMAGRRSGCIVNISSSAGKTAHPNASIAYGVSKAGLNSLTQKLAYDLAPENVRVNAICPGPVETDMSEQWSDEYRQKVLSSIPLCRLGTGADIAGVAVFLASELSSFVTGESINVNGGKYMN